MLTRIIVSRCEVDLKKISSEYKSSFGQSLQKTILVSESGGLTYFNDCCVVQPLIHFLFLQEHTKGDYQKALLSLCGPEA